VKRGNGKPLVVVVPTLPRRGHSISLIMMEAEEAAIAAREEQRNILEGYLYKLRDLLDSDSQHPFVTHSQDAERRAISRQLKDVSSWFNSRSDDAQTKDFVEKRTSLECVSSIISISSARDAELFSTEH
jgi:hypoxia up-regulated 1